MMRMRMVLVRQSDQCLPTDEYLKVGSSNKLYETVAISHEFIS